MKNVCFIPARSTSTRLKNKNIAKYGNGNLVTHTIEQAKASGIFDRIILSSNSEEILEMGKKYNIELHLRDDKVDTIIAVMRNAIPELDIDDDTIGLLLVTCPLRSIDDIREAYKMFVGNNKGHTVISVNKNLNPIEMAFRVDDGGHLIPAMPINFLMSTRKQDHSDSFFFNDAIIIDTAKSFMDQYRPNLYGNSAIPYLMPPERSVGIDYEFQLKISRCLGEN